MFFDPPVYCDCSLQNGMQFEVLSQAPPVAHVVWPPDCGYAGYGCSSDFHQIQVNRGQ